MAFPGDESKDIKAESIAAEILMATGVARRVIIIKSTDGLAGLSGCVVHSFTSGRILVRVDHNNFINLEHESVNDK